LLLLHDVLGVAASQGQAGSIIEIGALRALVLAASSDRASAVGALTGALTLARRHGHVRVPADQGAPMRALLAQLLAARPGKQHPAGLHRPPATWPQSCAPAARQAPRRRASPSR
jgi:LuxR family transcriptional regulator, maltose regulon positive regulatory protein